MIRVMRLVRKLLSLLIYGLSSALGIGAFLSPFLWPTTSQAAHMGMAHAHDAPLMLTLLVGLCFVALLLEVQGQDVDTRVIALLGMLVGINAMLRFVEVAIPGPAGFSPIFLLIVLTGYIYGARFGFQMGAMTLLVSALITGSVGPWLPYQMFTAAWVGLSAPLCRPVVRAVRGEHTWREGVVLALFGGMWGFLYGAIMNLWFWPFAVGPDTQYWQPGIGLLSTIQRYALFYLVTSLGWDVFRALGNVILLMVFGVPALRVFRRFHRRFGFHYSPTPSTAAVTVGTRGPMPKHY